MSGSEYKSGQSNLVYQSNLATFPLIVSANQWTFQARKDLLLQSATSRNNLDFSDALHLFPPEEIERDYLHPAFVLTMPAG
jgi:hypothetical protein